MKQVAILAFSSPALPSDIECEKRFGTRMMSNVEYNGYTMPSFSRPPDLKNVELETS